MAHMNGFGKTDEVSLVTLSVNVSGKSGGDWHGQNKAGTADNGADDFFGDHFIIKDHPQSLIVVAVKKQKQRQGSAGIS